MIQARNMKHPQRYFARELFARVNQVDVLCRRIGMGGQMVGNAHDFVTTLCSRDTFSLGS